MADKSKDIGRVIGYGSVTGVLYSLLFFYEFEILQLTSTGGWTFLIPVAVAFALSYTHGGFTGAFWDFLGIKAKK